MKRHPNIDVVDVLHRISPEDRNERFRRALQLVAIARSRALRKAGVGDDSRPLMTPAQYAAENRRQLRSLLAHQQGSGR